MSATGKNDDKKDAPARPATTATQTAKPAATSTSSTRVRQKGERAEVSAQEAEDARVSALPMVSKGIANVAPRPAKSSGGNVIIEDTEEQVQRDVKARPARIKVQATQMGYFDHIRRRAGDVFTIPGDLREEDDVQEDATTGKKKTLHKKGEVQAFSTRWMRRVAAGTPERITTGKQDLARQHDEILGAKFGAQPDGGTRHDREPVGTATGDDSPLE